MTNLAMFIPTNKQRGISPIHPTMPSIRTQTTCTRAPDCLGQNHLF